MLRNIIRINKNSTASKALLKKYNPSSCLQVGGACVREKSLSVGTYDQVYRNSIEKREEFWDEIAQDIVWHKPYRRVLDQDSPPTSPRWFPGGELNTCYNAVDRHVDRGLGTRTAIIHDSPITGTKTSITYSQLLDKVNKLAGVLSNLGVCKDDKVLIYMPMIPEAIMAMLATTRLGATHSVVFGGFAPAQLSSRIDHLKPKVVLIASCGIEPSRTIEYKPLLDSAIQISHHKPSHCIVFQRDDLPKADLKPGVDLNWQEEVEYSKGHDPVPVDSNHPCYVLYTSGTTGNPKGVVRPTGGHAVVLPWTMNALFGMKDTDTWWAASDLGWVVGHSYICYGPLLNGNTTVVYEGKPVGTPNSKQFYRVIEENEVSGMFTAPTALRAIKIADPSAKLSNNSKLRHLFVAGEALDHETRQWAESSYGVPVLNNFWQTETGFPITTHCMGLDMKKNPPKGSTGKPSIGFDIELMTSEKKKVGTGELGRILCRLPLPPGCFNTLYEAHDRYIEAYFTQFPRYYDTMDAGMFDNEGYVSVLSREDDVINVAGHRLSTLALEEVVFEHPNVAGTAIFGVPDEMKGVIPFGLVVTKQSQNEDELAKELIALVRSRIGPVAAFKHFAVVKGLPHTRSGKIPRGTLASLARGEKVTIPPTIEDHTIYTDVHAALKRRGFAIDAPDPTMD